MAELASETKRLLSKTLDKAKDGLSRVDLKQAAEHARSGISRIDVKQTTDNIKKLAAKGVQATKAGVEEVDFKQHALDLKAWSTKNPALAIFYVWNGVIFLAPGLVANPALAIAGYGAKDIVVGSPAAITQASVGPVAGGVFAHLQSAAMGGYGAPIVRGATRIAAAIAQAAGVAIAGEHKMWSQATTVGAGESKQAQPGEKLDGPIESNIGTEVEDGETKFIGSDDIVLQECKASSSIMRSKP